MMKARQISLLGIFFLFASCGKEESMKDQVQLTGKWMLVNYVEEEYRPVTQLVSRTETPGLPGDSLVFKTNNRVYTYSDIDGNHVESYQLVNDIIIRIESEEWTISKLNGTELHLLSDETDITANERSVVKAFLKRP